MDPGWAAVIGASVGAFFGFAGGGLTLAAQARRERAQNLGRTRGMARMVGAELKWAHIRISNAPLPEPGEEEEEISTQAWDRYGPDICAELPLSVVDPLLTAYGVIGMNQRRARKGTELTAEAIALLNTTAEGRAKIGERRALDQRARDQLLRAIAKGFDALHPYMGDT